MCLTLILYLVGACVFVEELIIFLVSITLKNKTAWPFLRQCIKDGAFCTKTAEVIYLIHTCTYELIVYPTVATISEIAEDDAANRQETSKP